MKILLPWLSLGFFWILQLTFKKILLTMIAFTLLISSCDYSKKTATSKYYLKLAEQEDHSKCLKAGFKLGKWGDIQNENYWSCRLDLVNARFIHDATTHNAIESNKITNAIKRRITFRGKNSYFLNLSSIKSDTPLSTID